MLLILALLYAPSVHACDKEHHYRHHDRHLERRDTAPVFPPTLTVNEKLLASSFDNTSIASWSSYYCLTAHRRNLAGEGETVPKWTAERWNEHGFETRLDSYHVYLDYPVHLSLSLDHGNGSTYHATLEEEILEEDGPTGDADRVPAFHGYSGSGDASAEYIYVGRASQEDFKRLLALNITLEGKIALAKYGGPFRGLKVKNAQTFGMIGAVIFTDPGDDRNMAAGNYATYPDGPARNPTSIQKGSVMDLSTYPGDPTTPGYPSKEGVVRKEKKTVPKIPSLPISWLEAKPLLVALNGHGFDAKTVNRLNWVGAIDGVDYSTGPSKAVLSISNIMRGETNWIHNAIGIVNGTNEDEVVIVGNHHDSWMIGGAADPHSGSAILIELAKAIGTLLKTGWKPKRTIVLCSWDAEEYGLVGSTEWVEEYIPWLTSSVVSYLNIDVGIAGTIPDFSTTPDLHALTTSTARKVIWPHGKNRTLYDVWEEKTGEIDTLGAQSDYTAFVHRAGISAIDMGTTRAPLDPIYHTHSNFDSFHWMTKFADPGFVMHTAIGKFLTLMLYCLVDEEIVPLEPANYGVEMRAWLKELEGIVKESNTKVNLDLGELENSVAVFEDAARQFNAARNMAVSSNSSVLKTQLNHKARDFGRGFVSEGGLPGREFYRHLVFAPGVDTGYAPVTYPGVTEAVVAGNTTLAEEFVGKTAKAILAAANILL
ncbi:putative glutamate carboxypeptidase [Alternaria tenuissima]|uniref:Glutamate carboxypeptidase n=3 Tax=Alternaria sect. Alternaria TaxID=2499237 RepID=A0A4Q4MQX6_9PLEO|nr:N-acetylated-alpha-linked acidic dipeptidase 2 [Alternaria alternata]RYN24290.1 putative glutamate carboxypeptidase [Alternaria tenuissima]RYN57325.1 putative glutamate carboxypeptidase [Alternaria tenuissima]RYN82157.1 putative glutamate carboxypeptidase [Alternaria alternata]RYO04695.1 putative glutamate carboxypeptidase [Alternaria tenuissima]